jgi:AAA+ superfamily predicted ATPase
LVLTTAAAHPHSIQLGGLLTYKSCNCSRGFTNILAKKVKILFLSIKFPKIIGEKILEIGSQIKAIYKLFYKMALLTS